MLETSVTFWCLATLAAVMVGLSKGGLPGVGTLGVPIMALAISPLTAAAMLLPIYIASDLFGLWAYRKHYDLANLKILIPATTIGVTVGGLTASFVPERLALLLIGVIGLLFCLDQWLKRHRNLAPHAPDVPRGLFWGSIAGFTSFVAHAGAPPYQMYTLPQRMEKLVFAGTTQILFSYVNAIKLVPYWWLGQFTTPNLTTALYLAGPAVIATLIGVRIVNRIPQAFFYKLVYASLFLVSLKLVHDAARG
jgi:uncharacterized protein